MPLSSNLAALALAVTLAGASAAFAEAQTDDPAARAQSLEAAFEDRTRKVGIAAAFKEFASPEALMFLPGPVKIWPKLEGAFWAGDVVWKPEVIITSSEGDMVVTAGPSLWTTAGEPNAGIYLTVWRTFGETMKFTLDRGLDIPRNLYGEKAAPTVLRSSGRRSIPEAEAAVRAEEKAIASQDASQSALIAKLDRQARVYRSNHAPAVGSEAAELIRATVATDVELSEVHLAASGDLAYTWGKQKVDGRDVYFTRAWLFTPSGWRIALDFAA